MWLVWIVFCDCGFHSLCPLIDRDKRLMEASWWERLTEGQTGSWFDGCGHQYGHVFSKSLIQFSVDGRACVPSLLLDLRPNYGGDNEDNGALLQKVPWCTAALRASDPAAGHRRPTPPLEIPGYSWACLGQFFVRSLLLSPGSWCAQGFVGALQESVPQSCVSSGGSMVGFMVTSSKRA